MKRIILLALALMLALTPVHALAADVAAYTADFYVADHANVLDDEVEGLIVLNNDALDKACGAQIVVVTVDTVGASTIENYAYTLFNEWGIGDKGKNNGLLILLAIQDGQYWLMPGKGLQDYLPAGDLDEMATEHLLPHAQSGDFNQGVRQLFGACFEYISVAYDAGVELDDTLYYTWLQTGGSGTGGAKYLSEPVREVVATAEPEPVVEATQEPVRNEPAREEKGGFSFLHLIIILVVLIVIFGGAGRVRRNRPGRSSAPRRTAPPPPPVGGFRTTPPVHRPTTRPTVTTRPPMGGMGSRPVSRPPMGGTTGSRPMNRPSSGSSFGSSRTGGGGMTRGGGTGGSFSRPTGGFSRPSGGSTPVRRSGSGFGGGRSGGGGSTRGGGSGGSFGGGR